jgi:hypothetical protein
MSVIALLAALTLPALIHSKDQALAVTCKSMRRQIELAERMYEEAWKAPSTDIQALVDSKYLNMKELPKCPCGGEYLWIGERKLGVDPELGCSTHYYPLPPPEPEPGETTVFSSDMSSMDDFKRLRGKWKTSDGKLIPTGRGENRIAFGDTEWKDYEVRATATLQKGKGYGIYYRADGEKNITGYCFQYDPGLGNKFVVRKVINGRETRPIQSERMPAGFPVTGQPHNISIAVEGDHHTIKVDGETVMNFKDDSFESGSAGFRSWSRSKVEFDNVDVIQNKQ